MFRTFNAQEQPSRPVTLADTPGYSYTYDFNQHTPQYAPLFNGFGEPLGNPERCHPQLNQTEDRGKSNSYYLKASRPKYGS